MVCDTMCVIGCFLRQNDAHLIDLLFKAHLERIEAFDIEIIGPAKTGQAIQANYGFFPGIEGLAQIEGGMVSEPDPPNPFKTWLKYKSLRIFKNRNIKRSHYLKTRIK